MKIYFKIFVDEFNAILEQASLTNGQKICTPACDRLVEDPEIRSTPDKKWTVFFLTQLLCTTRLSRHFVYRLCLGFGDVDGAIHGIKHHLADSVRVGCFVNTGQRFIL